MDQFTLARLLAHGDLVGVPNGVLPVRCAILDLVDVPQEHPYICPVCKRRHETQSPQGLGYAVNGTAVTNRRLICMACAGTFSIQTRAAALAWSNWSVQKQREAEVLAQINCIVNGDPFSGLTPERVRELLEEAEIEIKKAEEGKS